MAKQTKIVATVSDIRCEVEFVRALYQNGMNVARMNSAHINAEGFKRIISNVRAVSPKIAILMDTKGPELRTTSIENEGRIDFKTGDLVKITGNTELLTTREQININYASFVEDLNVDCTVLIDDGELEFKVLSKENGVLNCRAENNGELGARKSVNVPGVRINLPSLTEKDKNNILLAIEQEVDFIAHSFVRNKKDVLDIQAILDAHNSPIKIIAKIENQEGVDNIDEILEAAYGVMVARGDLGIEVPQEKIPGIQRLLIRKCVQAKKPVIVATQMLHSMIKNPRPTRAEVTDIANAIYYRTDALMLSGETAYGKYPIEAIATMSKIAEEAEKDKISENNIRVVDDEEGLTVTAFLAKQAVKAINKLNVRAIITDSYTGRTARNIAAYRGDCPVMPICYTERTMRELALSYGLHPICQPVRTSSRDYFYKGITRLLDKGWLQEDETIAYIGGAFGMSEGSTFLDINKVSTVLERYDHYLIPSLENTKK